MKIVTLTTDFGPRDYPSGVLKGALLSRQPQLQLVDISHAVEAFNIVQGAFLLKQVYPEFPPGTIHILAVHNFYASDFRLLAFSRHDHWFITPDNGLPSLLFPDMKPPEATVLPMEPAMPNEPPFSLLKNSIARAVEKLSAGMTPEALGAQANQLQMRISLQPVITPASIRGTVIHIDQFENIVINITREVFDRVRNGRNFQLFFKRHDPITVLSANYSDVPEGEPLCLFNAAGYLEVAIHLGRGASLLGMKVEDVVEVLFT